MSIYQFSQHMYEVWISVRYVKCLWLHFTFGNVWLLNHCNWFYRLMDEPPKIRMWEITLFFVGENWLRVCANNGKKVCILVVSESFSHALSHIHKLLKFNIKKSIYVNVSPKNNCEAVQLKYFVFFFIFISSRSAIVIKHLSFCTLLLKFFLWVGIQFGRSASII